MTAFTKRVSKLAGREPPLHIPLDAKSAFGVSPLRGTGKVENWGGRPISKWTRWGFWSEDGTTFTPTRVI